MTFGSLRKGTGVALLAGALAGSCTGFGGSGPPDVVLIVVDTLRADHLTQYGYGRETSSALAEFSSAATGFSNAYSTSSWTQPAVTSLLTGLLPPRHGVVKQSTRLPEELATVQEVLSGAGWQTAGFSGNLFIGEKTGFDRGFEHFEGHSGRVLVYPDISDMIAKVDSWLADVRDRRRPGFLYFQPMNCHGPYRVPVEHRSDLLGQEPDRTFDYNDELMTTILKDGDLEARGRVTPEYLQSLTDQYDTAVRYSMDSVAGLLSTLKKEGLYDDALVIVTSDHGEELFEHGGFGHAYSLFEEVVRIPLWIKLPDQREGSVVDAPVSLVDLMPTILDVAGLPALEGLDGLSLAPLLEDGSAPGFRGRPIVADTRWKRRAVASAIRLGAYKLIDVESDYSGRADEHLLFNLEADPAELVDLASSAPDKVAALSETLRRALAADGARIETEEATGLDLDVLRALGYVD